MHDKVETRGNPGRRVRRALTRPRTGDRTMENQGKLPETASRRIWLGMSDAEKLECMRQTVQAIVAGLGEETHGEEERMSRTFATTKYVSADEVVEIMPGIWPAEAYTLEIRTRGYGDGVEGRTTVVVRTAVLAGILFPDGVAA